jgi:hypothetical protein
MMGCINLSQVFDACNNFDMDITSVWNGLIYVHESSFPKILIFYEKKNIHKNEYVCTIPLI